MIGNDTNEAPQTNASPDNNLNTFEQSFPLVEYAEYKKDASGSFILPELEKLIDNPNYPIESLTNEEGVYTKEAFLLLYNCVHILNTIFNNNDLITTKIAKGVYYKSQLDKVCAYFNAINITNEALKITANLAIGLLDHTTNKSPHFKKLMSSHSYLGIKDILNGLITNLKRKIYVFNNLTQTAELADYLKTKKSAADNITLKIDNFVAQVKPLEKKLADLKAESHDGRIKSTSIKKGIDELDAQSNKIIQDLAQFIDTINPEISNFNSNIAVVKYVLKTPEQKQQIEKLKDDFKIEVADYNSYFHTVLIKKHFETQLDVCEKGLPINKFCNQAQALIANYQQKNLDYIAYLDIDNEYKQLLHCRSVLQTDATSFKDLKFLSPLDSKIVASSGRIQSLIDEGMNFNKTFNPDDYEQKFKTALDEEILQRELLLKEFCTNEETSFHEFKDLVVQKRNELQDLTSFRHDISSAKDDQKLFTDKNLISFLIEITKANNENQVLSNKLEMLRAAANEEYEDYRPENKPSFFSLKYWQHLMGNEFAARNAYKQELLTHLDRAINTIQSDNIKSAAASAQIINAHELCKVIERDIKAAELNKLAVSNSYYPKPIAKIIDFCSKYIFFTDRIKADEAELNKIVVTNSEKFIRSD